MMEGKKLLALLKSIGIGVQERWWKKLMDKTRYDLNQYVEKLRPARKHLVVNDKPTKLLFSLRPDIVPATIDEDIAWIVPEVKRKGKKLESRLIVGIDPEKRAEAKRMLMRLTEFDLAVLNACVSEIAIGNYVTTPEAIYRHLTGKVGKTAYPTERIRAAIMASLRKMAMIRITLDYADCLELLNGAKLEPEEFTGYILPSEIIHGKYCDKPITLIRLLSRSPLHAVAMAKRQMLTYDVTLLDVPNQNNTPRIIEVKNYTLRRVMEIRQHNLTPTITFGDVFKKCRLDEVTRKSQSDARNAMLELFQQLEEKKVISAFDIVKNGNALYSLQFKYQP